MTEALTLVYDLVQSFLLKAQGKIATRYIAKEYTSAPLILSSTSGAPSAFAPENLGNSRYPFVLKQVDIVDTASESNWGLVLTDRSTGYTILGGGNPVSTRAIRGKDTAGNEKAGRTSGLGVMAGFGYVIGPNGGFNATAYSVGTTTTTELTLSGVWILEW